MIRDDNPTACTVGPDDSPLEEMERQSRPAYVLRREVSAGTFGEVWEAVQLTLRRVVAVKRPRTPGPDGLSDGWQQIEHEFLREAMTAGQLDHPNIVPVYDLGRDAQGRPLLAMKLVEGDRWDELIRSEDRTRREFLVRHVSILVKIAKAVAFAHSRGIVHRDLKPQQVMVGRFGEVYLMDWGLAVGLPGTESLRGSGAFVKPLAEASSPAGTVAFMAPEQTRPVPDGIGFWTDVYLLGGTLYYILTGEPPHGSEDSQAAFERAARGVVEPPEARAPGYPIPRELSAICMEALEAEPSRRPPSALRFVEALEGWLSGTAARSESRQVTAEAARLLESSSAESSYSLLEETDALLSRALTLWPDNPEASGLQRRLLETYAETALRHGDLSLAAAQAQRLPDALLRTALLDRISAAVRRVQAQARQFRLAVYSTLVLLVVLMALGLLIARTSAEAMVAESRLLAETAERDMQRLLAEQKRRHEERNAATYRRASQLQTAMAELVDLARREALTPTTLEAGEDWSVAWLNSRPAVREDLRRRLQEIDRMRQIIEEQGEWAEPEPAEISFARGVLALADGGTTGADEAYRHFLRAVTLQPLRHELRLAAGVAALRGGNTTSATMHLAEALQRARFTETLGHHMVVSMHYETNRLLWQGLSLEAGDLIIEAGRGGRENSRYREISGSWDDSSHASHYKSVAPGLTPPERCGTRRLLFYEPYRPVNPKVPARARFSPEFATPQRRHVYVTWPGEANATPVYYIIRHAGGEQVVALTQNGYSIDGEPNSNAWIPLGEFEFGSGPDQYVEVAVGDDVRPLAPERYGQVSVDAVLFAVRPLAAGIRPATVAADACPTGPLVCDAPDGESMPPLHWSTSLAEAEEEARRTSRPLFLYCWQPADSCFIHPINRNRDYCENHLLVHPAVTALLKEKFIPVSVDLSRSVELAKRYGAGGAGVELRIVRPGAEPASGGRSLKGDALLLSPAHLVAWAQEGEG